MHLLLGWYSWKISTMHLQLKWVIQIKNTRAKSFSGLMKSTCVDHISVMINFKWIWLIALKWTIQKNMWEGHSAPNCRRIRLPAVRIRRVLAAVWGIFFSFELTFVVPIENANESNAGISWIGIDYTCLVTFPSSTLSGIHQCGALFISIARSLALIRAHKHTHADNSIVCRKRSASFDFNLFARLAPIRDLCDFRFLYGKTADSICWCVQLC